jgi:hypothetical protein
MRFLRQKLLLNYKVSLAPLFQKGGERQTLYLRRSFGANGAFINIKYYKKIVV